jgi:transcriptional regulator with XRE-family HTH domain
MITDTHLATADELCRELGDRLRAQRLSQLLPQQELALRAGISTGALKKLEKDGQANMTTLVRTVLALGLAGEFETLFALRAQASIADMEHAERAKRLRAPRRSAR